MGTSTIEPRTTAATTHPRSDPGAWDQLAAAVATCTDHARVMRVVSEVAHHLDVATVPASAPLVVQQRAFGRLHREAGRRQLGGAPTVEWLVALTCH